MRTTKLQTNTTCDICKSSIVGDDFFSIEVYDAISNKSFTALKSNDVKRRQTSLSPDLRIMDFCSESCLKVVLLQTVTDFLLEIKPSKKKHASTII